MKLNELTESIDSNMAELATNYTSGNFDCDGNALTSLEGCPKEVTGNFDCGINKLTSLEHGPTEVTGDFNCCHNGLKSLEHCPKNIRYSIYCANNELTSLEGCPTIVHGDFDCRSNQLSSLEGCPKEIADEFAFPYNKITSLVGIHKHLKSCKRIQFDQFKIVEGGMGLLLIKNLTKISSRTEPFKIISKYLGQGVKGLPKCQQELIDAGYKEFAKL